MRAVEGLLGGAISSDGLVHEAGDLGVLLGVATSGGGFGHEAWHAGVFSKSPLLVMALFARLGTCRAFPESLQ